MWKRIVCSAWCAFGLAAAAAQGGAGAAAQVERRLGGDLFIAGGSVTVNQPVTGDLFASGGSIDVDAPVSGDAVALGGKVRIGADVGQSVYAASGQLAINGKVARNVRVAGGQAELGPKSEVAGNLSVAGGQVRLYGQVRGQVQAAGGRVLIDGPVGGDVLATSGHVELGPNARIAGKLRYRSGEPLVQDPAAQVAGGVEQLLPSLRRGDAARAPSDRYEEAPHARAGGVGWVWTLGLIVLAGVLLAALPGFYANVARSLRERPGTSLLLGFVVLVCAPVAALLMFITLIGIPLGLFTTALYLALLPVAYVSAGIGLGDWALTRWQPGRAAALRWRLAATAAALVALALIGWVPWLGALAGFAALLAGLGALALQARRLAPSAA